MRLACALHVYWLPGLQSVTGLAACHLTGAGHVDRADRICLACSSAVGNEKHISFARAAWAS